ncbi:7452_t:CDS:2 [Acaulospora morrowiae]|uniref:7452_t:CDS:1 n=1 Tax=Acaulospora morrowiae TaxID=94023 RepID=A0A9N8W7V8_9GLOM|nr:7452_t:CDS:2 [Acaulospora morrowiae]
MIVHQRFDLELHIILFSLSNVVTWYDMIVNLEGSNIRVVLPHFICRPVIFLLAKFQKAQKRPIRTLCCHYANASKLDKSMNKLLRKKQEWKANNFDDDFDNLSISDAAKKLVLSQSPEDFSRQLIRLFLTPARAKETLR